MLNFTKPVGPIHPDIRRASELLFDQHNPSGALAWINTALSAAGYSHPLSTNSTFDFLSIQGSGGDGTSSALRVNSSFSASPGSPSSVPGTSFARSGGCGGCESTVADKGKDGAAATTEPSVACRPARNGSEIKESRAQVMTTDSRPTTDLSPPNLKGTVRNTESDVVRKPLMRGVVSASSAAPWSGIASVRGMSGVILEFVQHAKERVVGQGSKTSTEEQALDLYLASSSIGSKKITECSGGSTETVGLSSFPSTDCIKGASSVPDASNPVALSLSSSSFVAEGKTKDKLNAVQLERLLLLKADALSTLSRHDISLQEALAAVEISQGGSPVAYFTVGREYRYLLRLDEAVLAFQKGESLITAVVHDYMRASRYAPSKKGWASTQYFSLAYWNKKQKQLQSTCSLRSSSLVAMEDRIGHRAEGIAWGMHSVGNGIAAASTQDCGAEDEENENFWASEGFSPEEAKEIGMSIEEYQWQQEALQHSREEAHQQKLEKIGKRGSHDGRLAGTELKTTDIPDAAKSVLSPSREKCKKQTNVHAQGVAHRCRASEEDTGRMGDKKEAAASSASFSSASSYFPERNLPGMPSLEEGKDDLTGCGRGLYDVKENNTLRGNALTCTQSLLSPRASTRCVGQETTSSGLTVDGRGEADNGIFSAFSASSSVSSLSDAELLGLLGMDQYELSVWRRLASECCALIAINISKTIPTSSFPAAFTTLWPKVKGVRNGVILAIENNSHDDLCFVGSALNSASHVDGYDSPRVIPKGHTGITLLQQTGWSGYLGTLCFEIENSLCCFFYFDLSTRGSKRVGVRLLEHQATDLRLAFDEANGETSKSVALSTAHSSSPPSINRAAPVSDSTSRIASLLFSNAEPYDHGRCHLAPSPAFSVHQPPTTASMGTASGSTPVSLAAPTSAALSAVKIPSTDVWLSSHSADSSRRRIKVAGRAAESRLIHFVVAKVPSVSLLPVELITALEYAGPVALKKLSVVNGACRTLVNHLPPWLFRNPPPRNLRSIQSHAGTNGGMMGGGNGGSYVGGASSLTGGTTSTIGTTGGGGVAGMLPKAPSPSLPGSGLAMGGTYPSPSLASSGSGTPHSTLGSYGAGSTGWNCGVPFVHSYFDVSNQAARPTSYPDYLLVMDRSCSPWVVRDRNVVQWRITSEQRVGERLDMMVMDIDCLPAPSTHAFSGSSNISSASSNGLSPLLTISKEVQTRNASIVYGDNLHRRTILIQLKEQGGFFRATAIRLETVLGNHFATVTSTSQGDFDFSFVGYGSIPDQVFYTARKQSPIDATPSHTINGVGNMDSHISSNTPSCTKDYVGATGNPTAPCVTGKVIHITDGGMQRISGSKNKNSNNTSSARSSGRAAIGMMHSTVRMTTGTVTSHSPPAVTTGRGVCEAETTYSVWRPRPECGGTLLNGPSFKTNNGQELVGEIVIFSAPSEGRRHVVAEVKLYPGADGLLCSALCYAILQLYNASDKKGSPSQI